MTTNDVEGPDGGGVIIENRNGVELYGDSPKARRASANILVSGARRESGSS